MHTYALIIYKIYKCKNACIYPFLLSVFVGHPLCLMACFFPLSIHEISTLGQRQIQGGRLMINKINSLHEGCAVRCWRTGYRKINNLEEPVCNCAGISKLTSLPAEHDLSSFSIPGILLTHSGITCESQRASCELEIL